MSLRIVGVMLAGSLVAACSSPGAVFVTKTSLSIVDADSTPAGVSFGFDRVEGFIGPVNPDGTVPSVVAKIETDGKIFNSKIKQIYATGSAAEAVAGYTAPAGTVTPDATDKKRLAFFGTSTSTALKVGFSTSGTPNTFVLGYRRKELSVIPSLARVTNNGETKGHYVYPPLLAAIDTGASASTGSTATFGVCQSFASGPAATKMAADSRAGLPSLGCGNASVAELSQYRNSITRQTETYASLMRCYSGVTGADRQAIWEDAARHGLFVSAGETDEAKAAQGNADALKVLTDREAAATALADASAQANARRAVDRTYADFLLANNSGQVESAKLVGSPTRERLLTIHEEEVCRRARLNGSP